MPEIARLNILHASMLAMRRAIAALPVAPDHVLVDGNRVPGIAIPCTALVGGDALSLSIAAASIAAKELRDALMRRLHALRYAGFMAGRRMPAMPSRCIGRRSASTARPAIIARDGGAAAGLDANTLWRRQRASLRS